MPSSAAVRLWIPRRYIRNRWRWSCSNAVRCLSTVRTQWRNCRLCMKVTQSLGDRPGGTVGILSCNEGDGCSTVSYNLGLTLARKSDGRVLLVDANLRKPCMHRIFKTRMAPGLSDLITGGVGVSEVIRDTDVGNLKVLTAGSHLNNPG